MLPGESIGRNAFGSDTNAPSDFAPYGGVDAAGPTPGAANQSTFDDYIESAALAQGLGRAQPRPQQQAAPLPKKAWTIMVFIDGRDANLLPAWRSDINRMEEEGSNANVNIVVQLMRPDAERDRLQRFYIERETTSTIRNPVQTINDAAQAAPGNPATLAAFIDWAERNYPANRYAIVLAGHGNGWKGTMIAGARVDHLTMSEVDTGLEALDSGRFEVLVWYSCLMGQTEVAYQMQKRAKYMVASEEITWANTIPWQTFVAQLKTNLDWTPRQFGDELALKWADVLQTQTASKRIYTMASIDLDVVRPTLGTALTAFATQLRGDIATILNQLDNPTDNVQIRVKREARERAETFNDRNFIDTYHFAELVKGMGIPASGLAQPVMNAVLNSTTVIRHGSDRANAHGLSIYFPHDALQPNRRGGTWGRAFDDPLHDPYDSLIPTTGTHYYKRDATLLVPKIRNLEYPFKDDPNFDFPTDTTWDELLHRYYKPVADACIRHGGKCVKEVRVRVGTTLTLSGNGSSDSDGREGPSNDVPAHVSGIEHYYWDFNPNVDTGGARPPYVDNVEYVDCDGEDCDRDDVDETNDDKDAQGKTVTFTCTAPGTFPIHFMVWDEHHNERRERVENIRVNRGRHWLHFNVDESDVTIHCYAEKTSKPEKASVNEPIEYLITIVANAELTEVAPGAMTDPLPVEVVVNGEVTCTSGECFYDPEMHTVHWIGNLEPESEVEIKVPVRIPPREPSDPPLPPEIVNCATLFDGVESRQACTVTEILPPLET
ncbi:MAG: hypothetical protein DCC58_18045 [Chloroflexi bacterium]|nr:MAG: hypothetical protein DCC58_18045 [Chloroflexota bacterium]